MPWEAGGPSPNQHASATPSTRGRARGEGGRGGVYPPPDTAAVSKHETGTVTKQTTGAVSTHETGTVTKETTCSVSTHETDTVTRQTTGAVSKHETGSVTKCCVQAREDRYCD